MKKTISILLCLMMFLCGGVSVFAAAPIGESRPTIAPRFVNISKAKGKVNNYSDRFECIGYCQVANRTTIKITITLRDSSGKKIASKSGTKTGTEYTFKTDFNVTPGKKYIVDFAFDAGGERTSSTEEITA